MMPEDRKTEDTAPQQFPSVMATKSPAVAPPSDHQAVSVAAQPSSQNVQETQASASSPQIAADDAELIEDEWVAIVKKIIKENKDNPYLLSRAMTILRADYLKKRYKKDIKITE